MSFLSLIIRTDGISLLDPITVVIYWIPKMCVPTMSVLHKHYQWIPTIVRGSCHCFWIDWWGSQSLENFNSLLFRRPPIPGFRNQTRLIAESMFFPPSSAATSVFLLGGLCLAGYLAQGTLVMVRQQLVHVTVSVFLTCKHPAGYQIPLV